MWPIRCLAVETASPPTFYLPPEDVAWDRLEPAPGASRCEWKGVAGYWDVVAGGRRAARAAWSYPEPFADFADLRPYAERERWSDSFSQTEQELARAGLLNRSSRSTAGVLALSDGVGEREFYPGISLAPTQNPRVHALNPTGDQRNGATPVEVEYAIQENQRYGSADIDPSLLPPTKSHWQVDLLTTIRAREHAKGTSVLASQLFCLDREPILFLMRIQGAHRIPSHQSRSALHC